jgi:hypothetical protein
MRDAQVDAADSRPQFDHAIAIAGVALNPNGQNARLASR